MTKVDKVIEILAMVLRVDQQKLSTLSHDTLLTNIGMDSINCVEIVVHLEEEFGVWFDDSELMIRNLNSINKLVGKIEAKLEEQFSV